jgi:tRNA A37 threonylcarbamoyladenosine dehydratase
MSVSQKTPLALEREVRKNLRRRGYSDSFKIKCAFKVETEHTLETSSHHIPYSKSSSLASFRPVLNDALEKTFRI